MGVVIVDAYTDNYVRRRNVERSKPPYKPKAYWLEEVRSQYYNAKNVSAAVSMDASLTRLRNTLYERFQSKLGESSSFGATLTAELNETVGMLSGAVLRAYKAARCVKKLDFRGCADALGLPYRERTVTKTRFKRGRSGRRTAIVSRKRVFQLPTGREVQKTLANGWLLWSYGVRPLASDIYTALDTLQQPIRYEDRITVSARGPDLAYKSVYVPSPGRAIIDVRSGTTRGRCGAWVTVVNPNLYLANKLGLTNPLQWALEAIPFSFIVDWFSNLSTVVGAFSAYEGLSLERTWMCTLARYEGSITDTAAPNVSSWNSMYFTRSVTLPTPKLVFEYERFRPQRALNAISLLVGFLPRNR